MGGGRAQGAIVLGAGETRSWLKRSGVGWLLSLGALACAMAVPASPAHASGLPPWFKCFAAGNANRVALEASLSPANGATVQTGTPVTFSGSSTPPVTFAVASSTALLSSPDIDSGSGTLQPGTSTYTFTSTKATATPGTVYWDASFSDATIAECAGESPTTFTTKARTFTVVSPSPPATETEAAAKRKQEEEAAAKKKSEEKAPAGAGGVSKPKVRSLTRTQRLAAALERCHKKGRRQRVMVCERQARKRFSQVDKTKNKK